jgi:FkbM family methyltransferase
MFNAYRNLHYTWRHRAIATVSHHVKFTYTIRHGLSAGMKRRGGLGFLPWGPVETAETRFLRGLDLAGRVVYDIGAFEGVLTMFFSRTAKQVVAWEPNPQSRARLQTNLRLNQIANVTVRDVGLSCNTGQATLVYDRLMPGAASAGEAVASQIREQAPTIVEIGMRVVQLDDDIRSNGLPPPDFIKIDVEGMELAVIRGAERTLRTHQPALYIELHGAEDADKRRNAQEVASALWDLGYHDLLSVEPGKKITPATIGRAGHIFCQVRPVIASAEAAMSG